MRRGVTRGEAFEFGLSYKQRTIASSPQIPKNPPWPRWHASPGAHYAVWYANFFLTVIIVLSFRGFPALWGPCVADIRRLDTAQLTAWRDV